MHSSSGFRILPKNNSVKNMSSIKGINSIIFNFINQNPKESPYLVNNIMNNQEKDRSKNQKIPYKSRATNEHSKTQNKNFIKEFLSSANDKEIKTIYKNPFSLEKRAEANKNNSFNNKSGNSNYGNKTNSTSKVNIQNYNFGNEGNGLKDETAALADTYIKIPMSGKVESLNAAVATSVLMYEHSRQTRVGLEHNKG